MLVITLLMAIDLSTDKSTSEYNMVLSASLFNDTYNFLAFTPQLRSYQEG